MTDKTIPLLTAATEIDGNTLFIIDSGTQTFKCEADVIALFMRESLLPAGMISDFAGAEADIPSGWLICAGQAVSRATYARLFAAISTTYGIGDGSSTFNLPDCRGRVRAGKDNMGGTAANRITNAIAGFVGTLLGAVGGNESYTPAGINGGSQSIAHVHSISHTHTHSHDHLFSHVHMIGHTNGTTLFGRPGADTASTTIGNLTSDRITNQIAVASGAGETPADVVSTDDWWTTGVMFPPGGSSGAACYTGNASPSTTTSGPNNADTGAMSTASTVNGVSFSFTGTAAHRVQPTIIVNTIIKT